MTRLVLASASPRRRELLARAGLEFDVRPADVDETVAEDADPADAALALARRKWESAALRLGADEIALAADTVVGLVGPAPRLLGKPACAAEAAAMLRALSGTRHLVATGVAAGRRGEEPRCAVARTYVTMRVITEAEVEDYVASGEWRDKAGGYAIQESADRFVTGLEGDGFDNVVGLPVALTLGLLAAAGHAGAARARGGA